MDSHIHLSHFLFEEKVPCIVSSENNERIEYMDRKQLIETFNKNQIAFCVEPGIDFESNSKILDLAKEYENFIYPAVGVHPTRTPQTKWMKRKEIERLSENEAVIAIGELGLDYHYPRLKQHRFKQKMWFVWQLKLAHKRNLPLILHIRLADEDAIKILRRHKDKLHGGVCHCFNQGIDVAKVYTEEFGFMLGIGGSLLRENCDELEQVVVETPLEYLLLETDGPYVKPQKPDGVSKKQWEKARNTSLIISDVAARIAQLKCIDISEVEKITTENAKKLFIKVRGTV